MKKLLALALCLCMIMGFGVFSAYAEEEITLKLILPECPDMQGAPGAPYWDWLYEQCGVRIEVELVPTDQMTLRLASLDFPDVMGHFWTQGVEAVAMAAEGGYVWELTDERLAEYCPTIKEAWDRNPLLKSFATDADGKLWSLPNFTAVGNAYNSEGPSYNIAIMEKLGLEMPTTTSEFKAYLEAVQKATAEGILPKGTLPLTFEKFSTNNMPMTELPIFSYFGGIVVRDVTRKQDMLYVTDNKTVSSNFYDKKEELKAAFRYLSSLYQEGLFNDLVFTEGMVEIEARMSSDTPPAVVFINGDAQGYVAGIPLKNDEGFASYYELGISGSLGIYGATWTIFNNCKHPEAALRVAEAMCKSTENMIRTWWGLIGEGYYIPYYDAETEMFTTDWSADTSKWGPEAWCPAMHVPNVTDTYWWSQHQIRDLTEGTKNYIINTWLDKNPEFKSIDQGYSYFPSLPNYCYEEGEVELCSQYRIDFTSLWMNKSANWIMDSSNIDTEFDQMIKELEQMGYKDYLDIQQRAFDKFNQ